MYNKAVLRGTEIKPPIEFIKKDEKRNLLIFIHGFTSDSNT